MTFPFDNSLLPNSIPTNTNPDEFINKWLIKNKEFLIDHTPRPVNKRPDKKFVKNILFRTVLSNQGQEVRRHLERDNKYFKEREIEKEKKKKEKEKEKEITKKRKYDSHEYDSQVPRKKKKISKYHEKYIYENDDERDYYSSDKYYRRKNESYEYKRDSREYYSSSDKYYKRERKYRSHRESDSSDSYDNSPERDDYKNYSRSRSHSKRY